MLDNPYELHKLTENLRSYANELGFPLFGIADAIAPPRYSHFLNWIEKGMAGSMHYLESRAAAYAHPRHVLEGCQRVIMLGVPYPKSIDTQPPSGMTRIASYASGSVDYHDWIHDRLKLLKQWFHEQIPRANIRGVVDTAPILEREFAQLAGLGWIGKNTLLLTRSHGSYFFLAALLTDIPLPFNQPFDADHCGSCRACLDACPTQAFAAPRVLDANRCISYLTIEHRDDIAPELAEKMKDWLFGCDVCQQVCPWNRKPNPEVDEEFQSIYADQKIDLLELLKMDREEFRRRFRKTPLWRTKWEGLMRNACIAAGNQKLASALPYLEVLAEHEDERLQSAARWAILEVKSSFSARKN